MVSLRGNSPAMILMTNILKVIAVLIAMKAESCVSYHGYRAGIPRPRIPIHSVPYFTYDLPMRVRVPVTNYRYNGMPGWRSSPTFGRYGYGQIRRYPIAFRYPDSTDKNREETPKAIGQKYESQSPKKQIFGNEFPEEREMVMSAWGKEEKSARDEKAEANKAFIRNLILAQVGTDGEGQDIDPIAAFENSGEDAWSYGIVTTGIEEKERVRQYFKHRSKEMKAAREREAIARGEITTTPPPPTTTTTKKPRFLAMLPKIVITPNMTSEEYFNKQKQIMAQSRKNTLAKVRGTPKQYLRGYPETGKIEPWTQEEAEEMAAYYGRKKPSRPKMKTVYQQFLEETATTTSPAPPTTPRGRRPGQMEYVMGRPIKPLRRPFADFEFTPVYTTTPSPVESLRKLLILDSQQLPKVVRRPRKRFMNDGNEENTAEDNEDELVAELEELKVIGPEYPPSANVHPTGVAERSA